METQLSNEAFTEAFHEWVKDALPKLNVAIENGHHSLEVLIAEFKPWVERIVHRQQFDFPFLSRAEARQLIQLLGFGLSSVERHAQMQHHSGIAIFSDIEAVLEDLAVRAAHPPRDSHYTYWLYNRAAPYLSFTGNEQEYFFNRVVNQTDALHSVSCNALRPICEGRMSLLHHASLEAIRLTADNMHLLHQSFRAFMDRNETRQRNMEPDFFMRRMRTYLPTYQINGVEWGGVNAANLASQMQVDYLLGTVNPQYSQVVAGRFRYLTAEDQFALDYDMNLPSLFDVILSYLKLDRAQFPEMPIQQLAAHLALQSSAVQMILCAYAEAIEKAAQLTAMHWALIQNYLVKPARQMSEDEKRKLAVRPDVGTGGKTHHETEAIMRMRREHPLVWKLVDAIREVYHA